MSTPRIALPRKTPLGRLFLIALALPTGLTIGFEVFRVVVLNTTLAPLVSNLLAAGLTVLGVFLFSVIVFSIIERSQRRILKQNLELAALSAVSTAASEAHQVERELTLALNRLLEAREGDAAELRVWDRDRQQLAPWIHAAHRPEDSSELAQLTTMLVESNPAVLTVPDFNVDLAQDPRFVTARAATGGLGSLVSLPLTVGERRLGLLTIGFRRAGALEPADRPFLVHFSGQLAATLGSRRLFEELAQREREARALYEIATTVLASLDVDQVLEAVVEHTRALFKVETVTICVMDEQQRGLVPARRSGPPDLYTSGARSTVDNGHRRGTVYGSPIGAGTKPFCCALKDGCGQCHAMEPLRIGNKIIGEICIGGDLPRPFGPREREILAVLANQASVALSNARLYERSQHTAILEERDRIAREMHDSLAQVLGYLALQTRVVRKRLTSESIAACQRELEEIAKVADEAYVDVREAILGLRESITPGTGLASTLTEYLQKYTRQSGIAARLALESGAAPRLSPAAEVQLVRIVQEALTNVRKHAEATSVWVRLDVDEKRFARVVIEDNGAGFEPAGRADPRIPGFGLQTMAERAARVGGTLVIDSAPGHGCRVTIRLPMGPEEIAYGPDTRVANGRPPALP